MRLIGDNTTFAPRRHPSDLVARTLILAAYTITFLLAALAIHLVVSHILQWGQIWLDDRYYGHPRTTHLDGFVGHEAGGDVPTHFIALNLQRQVVVLELPGNNPADVRSLPGPYLFGDDEALTPVMLELADVDKDSLVDLLIKVRNEQIVYLNRDGTFRLPTPEEQATFLQEQVQ